MNSWWRFSWFLGYEVRLWCDTPSLRTGIFAVDLCGNMSWGIKPRFSASWGLGSMPIKSWFCRYEFMVLPGRKTNLIKRFSLSLTYAYATLWQSVAGNSTFWGIVFCNLGTPKQLFQNLRPHILPYIYPHMVTPTMFLVDKKSRGQKKARTKMY